MKVHPYQPYMVEVTVYDLSEFDGTEKTEPRHVHSRRIQFNNEWILNTLSDTANELEDIIKADVAVNAYKQTVGHEAIIACVKDGEPCEKCRKLFSLGAK